MNILTKEFRLVQNPALGAFLLWRFVSTYRTTHPTGDHPNVLMLFLVLPLVYQSDICRLINATQTVSGMHIFVSKFSDSQESKGDLLLSIHTRVDRLKSLTFESIGLASLTGLISVDFRTGLVVDHDKRPPTYLKHEGAPTLVRATERLATWFSHMKFQDIAATLKVNF